ncbi:hypothetical protein [Micromonospora aurantiaca (nom. illeg.)]|uniref:hypothetical protein n=1 Tax=Micromonospora aurantiaca (nom. illeg.) TaxID=47850 RepID=UPI001180F157
MTFVTVVAAGDRLDKSGESARTSPFREPPERIGAGGAAGSRAAVVLPSAKPAAPRPWSWLRCRPDAAPPRVPPALRRRRAAPPPTPSAGPDPGDRQ